MTTQQDIQRQFFAHIKDMVGSEVMIAEAQEILNLKKGAIYKRMNGETALTVAEMVLLADSFRLSLDTIFASKYFISFLHPFTAKHSSVEFFDRFSGYISRVRQSSNSSMTYLANELPVFYYFSHEYIFNFLSSVWNHIHWQDSKLIVKKNTLIDERLQVLRKDITHYYNSHPVTEIWNSNMFANLYQQIIFSITIRAFEDVVFVENLIRDIDKLIQQLRQLALTGGGDSERQRKIYLNEFGNYMNMVLYQSDGLQAVFLGFDIPQYLVTYNQFIYEYAQNWVNKIRRRSVLISTEGYQYREMFFVKLEDDFENFKDKVQKLLAVYYN